MPSFGDILGDVGNVAKGAANVAFNPKYDPLGLMYQGVYKLGSAIKSGAAQQGYPVPGGDPGMANVKPPVSLGPAADAWLKSPAGVQWLKDNNMTYDPVTATVSGGGNKYLTPATPAAAAGTTPGVSDWNPLAVNMFTQQTLAPMLQGLVGQFQGWDQQLAQQAANVPGQQYLSPAQRAMGQGLQADLSKSSEDVTKAMMGAALTAPYIDSLQQQMSTLSQEALKTYTELLRQGASTTASDIFGGLTGPGGTSAANISNAIAAATTGINPGG